MNALIDDLGEGAKWLLLVEAPNGYFLVKASSNISYETL